MTAVKEMKVTESYLGLGKKITNCQTQEARSDCLTRRHRALVLSSCGCAPAQLRSYYGAEVRVCDPAQLDCVAKIRVSESECLEQCEGSSLLVERLYGSPKNEDGLKHFYEDYERYKNPDRENLTYPRAMKGKMKNMKH